MKFELLGKLRGDDEDDDMEMGGREAPVDQVRQMSQDGYSETEITEELRDQGYAYSEIQEALNEAVKESASSAGMGPQQGPPQQGPPGPGPDMQQGPPPQGGPGQQQGPPEQGPGQAPPPQQGPGQGGQMQQGPSQQGPPQQGGMQQGGGRQQPPQQQEQGGLPSVEEDEPADYDWGDDSNVDMSPQEEELVEIIVSEHVSQFEDDLDEMWEEIETVKQNIQELQEQIEEIQIRKDESENMFVESMESVEDHFEQTQARMGGMEKALQQVLPSLVENVRELSRTVEEMQEEQY